MKTLGVTFAILSLFPLYAGSSILSTGQVSGQNIAKGRWSPTIVGPEAVAIGWKWLAGGVIVLGLGIALWLWDHKNESN